MFFSATRRFYSVFFFSLFALSLCQNLYAASTVEIQIEGVEDELLKNVQANLSLELQKEHPRLSASRIRRLHKKAPEEIKLALQPFGYYNAKVTTAELKQPKPEETAWHARYVIDLGEPLKIKAVEVQLSGDAVKKPVKIKEMPICADAGKTKDEVSQDDEVFQDKAFKKLLCDFPVKEGEALNHPNYEKGKRVLRSLAEERGYFDAEITENKIIIDETAYTSNIKLSFDTKRRYRFGQITYKQDLFDESLFQRFLTFKPGEFYTSKALLALKNSLSNSDYFDKVEIDMQRLSPTEDLQLPVNVTLTPRKPNKYSAGIGYGTDTGPRGSLEWKRRYVNRYGHRFSAKTEWSEIRKSTTARYTIPTGQRTDDFLAITAGYRDENTDTSESEVWLVGISKHQPRTLFGSELGEVVGIEYRDEKYAIGSDTGHAKLLMPNISWSYVKADNRIYTLRGYKIRLGVRGALSNLGSNTSFLQTRLSGTFIRQLSSKGFFSKGRIITRGEAGYSDVSLVDGDFHDLPPSIRFFAGGDRSVRGYDYQTLGPKNFEGQVIGGKNLLVGSIEYEHKILEKWSLATFYDMGNAFNGTSEPLKRGTGVGVRWQSPIGLVRIDVATALSEEGRPWRLHITVGPDL